MKKDIIHTVKIFLLANIPALLLMGAGITMAFYKIKGWGWIVFVGLLMTVNVKN